MPPTILVCPKCGKTQERDAALRAGWLEHQRKNAQPGYLVIRCPPHITGHALRLAGLPQQKTCKRVTANLERGLWVEYAPGYIASVLGGLCDLEHAYAIQYHREGFPAFSVDHFETVEAMIVSMRNLEPDMRKWKLTELS